MTAEIRIVADTAELALAGAAEFASHAVASVRDRGIFTVALSGGSTPRELYSILASEAKWRDELPWQNMHFFWGDERPVGPDDPNSNYRMAHEVLLSRVAVPALNVRRIRGEEPDPRVAAEQYDQELRQFFRTANGQVPQFDLVLLGLGADGHTASLFPNTPALLELNSLVLANWVATLNTYRITLTLPILNNAANILFLVEGAEKATILRAVLAGDGLPIYPAQLIQPTTGHLIWLADREAGGAVSSFESGTIAEG